jgi:hypothetical protein
MRRERCCSARIVRSEPRVIPSSGMLTSSDVYSRDRGPAQKVSFDPSNVRFSDPAALVPIRPSRDYEYPRVGSHEYSRPNYYEYSRINYYKPSRIDYYEYLRIRSIAATPADMRSVGYRSSGCAPTRGATAPSSLPAAEQGLRAARRGVIPQLCDAESSTVRSGPLASSAGRPVGLSGG